MVTHYQHLIRQCEVSKFYCVFFAKLLQSFHKNCFQPSLMVVSRQASEAMVLHVTK